LRCSDGSSVSGEKRSRPGSAGHCPKIATSSASTKCCFPLDLYGRGGRNGAGFYFVAVLGASTYTFARATLGQGLAHWSDCHVRAFAFFQGTTKLLVPDNPRTGVTRACRYEPDLNRTYLEMAQH
jgi:hypothetical protein